MRTFADWLCYYNNIDVAPGLQAMEKMRDFYNEKRIDIQKLRCQHPRREAALSAP